jgi:hypothetical protein
MDEKNTVNLILNAPEDVSESVKDKLLELSVTLSDEELAYASVWFYEELLLRKEHLEKELLEVEEFSQWDAEELKNIIED